MVKACGASVPADKNPGVMLGIVLGVAANAGRALTGGFLYGGNGCYPVAHGSAHDIAGKGIADPRP